MNKEKLKSLQKYLDNLNNRLTAPLPEKHKAHPAPYLRFLRVEIDTLVKQIDAAKMDIGGKR
jgi:hypothetical protein